MKTAVEWRADVRELIQALTNCAWRSAVNGVDRVIALAVATQFADAVAKNDGGLGNAEVFAAMERLAQAAHAFARTAQAAGVGVVSIHNNQINTSEV